MKLHTNVSIKITSATSWYFSIVGPRSRCDGLVVRRCWVNFQCRGVLLIWIIVGQELTVLAVSAGGGCLDIFSLLCLFSFLSPSLWETARKRLKYCLKGPLSPKQPTKIKVTIAYGRDIYHLLGLSSFLFVFPRRRRRDIGLSMSVRSSVRLSGPSVHPSVRPPFRPEPLNDRG